MFINIYTLKVKKALKDSWISPIGHIDDLNRARAWKEYLEKSYSFAMIDKIRVWKGD